MGATRERPPQGPGLVLAAILIAAAGIPEAGAWFRRAKARPETVQPGAPLAVDLGGRITMDFAWIEDLGGWAARCETTNDQYRRYRPRHSSGSYRGVSLDAGEQPVVSVPCADGMEGAEPFAEWLTARERDAGRLPPGYVFRLPTPGEWRLLARCGRDGRFPWGAEWPPTSGNYADWSARELFGPSQVVTNYEDGFAVTAPVRRSGENPWGLFGVGGNVWEWTYEPDAGLVTVLGGSWLDRNESYLEVGGHYRLSPRYHFEGLGFRLVLMPETSPDN